MKTFNLYLRNYFEPGDAQKLAKFDAVALDVDAPTSVLNDIHSYNPNCRILAYIPINGTYDNANIFPAGSKWRAVWEAAEANNWWLRDTQGGLIYDHPGKRTTNCTFNCPVNGQGQSYMDWFPQFIAGTVLQNGAAPWDGVLLDDVWIGIWFVGNNRTLNALPIDADRDGTGDDQPTLDGWWKAGNDSLTARIRRLMPANEIVIGNGGNNFEQINGSYIESFPFNGLVDQNHPLGYSWTDKMWGSYGYFPNEALYSNQPLRMNVIDAKWSQGDRYNPVVSPAFERHKRFCMASALMSDGYFSLDRHASDGAHDSIWWFPEYDKPIGTPTGPATQVSYNGVTLWRRNFTNGVVLLNNNYATFTGSTASSIPPIGWVDARVLLNSELWHAEGVPPAAITDLAITRTWNNSAEVGWTNVGDDGTTGQAIQVEVRYSTSPITAANWGQASVASSSPIPELPGLTQTHIVTNLLSGQTYYFAAKTKDLSGNWGAISNVVSGLTVPGDVVGPAAITNLSVIATTATTATIQWTATGDDGSIGTASSYDIRYLPNLLSETTWGQGSQVVGEPVPTPAGSVQQLTLYGLSPSAVYAVGIKVSDEMPNTSPLSNVAVISTQAGDTTPPAAIQDLRFTGLGTNTVTLTWTAPGNDGIVGRANQYDMRWSRNPITAANFEFAGFITTEPGPALAGSTQSLTLNMGTGYTYYFAMKTTDDWGNVSGMSNVSSGTTNTTDTGAPGAITTLAVTATGPTSVALAWTATGDDGQTGTASSYEMRWSNSPITPANFTGATPVAWMPLPAAPGTLQTKTVGNLATGQPHYFAIRIADERSTWSPISNVVTTTTGAGSDLTAPAAIADFRVLSFTTNSVTVAWTAPGDDGATGTASSYDMRWSTTSISEINFATRSYITTEPQPAVAGTTQQLTIVGFSPGRTYYLALKTADEKPNWSAMSNLLSFTTLIDNTPPATISDLVGMLLAGDTVELGWTAPGDDNMTGLATTYDVRMATAPITDANFDQSPSLVGEPPPANPGSAQGFEVSDLLPGLTYWVAMKAIDDVGNRSAVSNVLTVETPATSGVPGPIAAPGLYLRSPNPVRTAARLELVLPAGTTGALSVSVFDVTGRVRRHLVDGPATPGAASLDWDGLDDSGRELANGVYFVGAAAPGFERVVRIVMTR
ncbi:MAG TPA: putative glycoside hydrolase [Candidatus Eisenbacteria bacterium]